jgi:hypothetical protein
MRTYLLICISVIVTLVYKKKHNSLRNHKAELKSLRDISSKVSIGEDGRAGEALELAMLCLSSTSSSLIPEKMHFLSVMHKRAQKQCRRFVHNTKYLHIVSTEQCHTPPPLYPASVGGWGGGVIISDDARHWIGLLQYNRSTIHKLFSRNPL